MQERDSIRTERDLRAQASELLAEQAGFEEDWNATGSEVDGGTDGGLEEGLVGGLVGGLNGSADLSRDDDAVGASFGGGAFDPDTIDVSSIGREPHGHEAAQPSAGARRQPEPRDRAEHEVRAKLAARVVSDVNGAHESRRAAGPPTRAAAGDVIEREDAQPPDTGADANLDVVAIEARLREEIRQRIQPEQYQTWFRRAALVRLAEGRIELAVQNNFARDWLCSYYRTVLRDAAHAVLGKSWEFTLSVDPELTADAPRSVVDPDSADPRDVGGPSGPTLAPRNGTGTGRSGGGPAPAGSSSTTSRGPSTANVPTTAGVLYESDFELNEKYTFDNFVVGPCNRFAHAAAFGAAESPGKSYNPFFLHGSVGLGKTHLLQSICFSLLERRPETRILFLSCETFVNHFINALEHGDIQRFRQKYRNVDVLVVDDIHLLANKERTQEEFFHTFNTLYNSGKQIVLSSDSPPKDIPKLQERLVSRFKWGLVTEIEAPCYETRMAILIRKSRERGREIDERVASLLAEHIDTNIRELEGAVNRLLTFAGLAGREITVELAREVLRDVFQVRKGAPTMDDIIRVVIEHFGVKLPELQSRKRTNAIAFPRQVVMYLARKITRHSLEEIGGFLGGRDHSTVLYAVEKISRLTGEDAESRRMIESFLERLEAPRGQ